MKAVLVRQFGEIDQLQVEEVPQPQPGPSDALVKVLAAGINQSDVKNVQGAMAGTTLPRIPGRDFAGEVVSGPKETVGRRVWGTGGDVGFTRDGSHAQYIAVPAAALTEMPRALSPESAGAAALTFVTAWSALVTAASVRPADTVLILGAAGGVGSAAVQIAGFFRAKVIAAVRSSEQAGRLRELRPAAIVDTSAKNLIDEVHTQTENHGVNVVFDTTGHLFAEAVDAAALGGRVCVISAPPDGKATFNLRALYRKELRVMGADTRRLDVIECSKLLAAMAQGFEDGKLIAAPPKAFPLDQAREAYRQAMKSEGRVCLVPNA
jgi:NADPH:quinone reductase